jgi:hypothetical protein
MSKFMSPEKALQRLVEDTAAPVLARCEALRQLAHPPLLLLRRLLVETAKRTKPVPARLRAIAAFAYARHRRSEDASDSRSIFQLTDLRGHHYESSPRKPRDLWTLAWLMLPQLYLAPPV